VVTLFLCQLDVAFTHVASVARFHSDARREVRLTLNRQTNVLDLFENCAIAGVRTDPLRKQPYGVASSPHAWGIVMSFLTDAEAASLRLARMSLHIVSNEDFVPEPELDIEHDDFLLERVRDIASDSVYRFQDISTTRDVVEQVSRRDVGFKKVPRRSPANSAGFTGAPPAMAPSSCSNSASKMPIRESMPC
jgi:hypothetical protein